jgi:hypothetical protein
MRNINVNYALEHLQPYIIIVSTCCGELSKNVWKTHMSKTMVV